MPRKRNIEHMGLPSRWKKEGHVYYYQVPKGQEDAWDGKRKFRLGKTLEEASAAWSARMEPTGEIHTIANLLDRYEAEVIPTKRPATRQKDYRSAKRLRATFGKMRLQDLKPRHIYMYIDKKSKKTIKDEKVVGGSTTAKHEYALLSHAYSKAVAWGLLDSHPFKGNIVIENTKSRDRYLEDWEVVEILSLKPFGTGHTEIVQSYIRLKLLTALRQNDILKMRLSDMKADGIHVTISKTGKKVIISWTEALRNEVENAKSLRPVDISPFLFCTREGKSYFNESKGNSTGWSSVWRRFVDRVLEQTKVEKRFVDSDFRAKAATDYADETAAQKLLTHSNVSTTRKHYLRKPELLQPTK